MAAEERTRPTCNSEDTSKKFCEDDAYKCRHYKKKFLMGYMQYSLNSSESNIQENNELIFDDTNFQLFDLKSSKSNLYQQHLENNANLFFKTEVDERMDCHFSSEYIYNQQYQLLHTDENNQKQLDLANHSAYSLYSRCDGANRSIAQIQRVKLQRFGQHVSNEAPLNLAVNKNPSIPDNVEVPTPGPTTISSTVLDEEIIHVPKKQKFNS